MRIIMRFSIVFLLLCFFFGISFAQSDVDLCFNYLKAGDYQRAIEAGKRVVRSYGWLVDSYFCLGIAYDAAGELNLALSSLKEAERLAKVKKDLAVIYNRIGIVYNNMGDPDNALLYYNRYLSLSKEIGDRKGESTALNNIASIFEQKGELDKALSYYEDSLKFKEEKDKATTHNNIAIVYDKKSNYEKAISYFQRAIKIYERYGDYDGTAKAILNMGDTYRRMKDFSQAEYYLNEGLKRIVKVGNKYWEATGYYYLGWFYGDKKEIPKAKDYFKKAYNIFEAIGAKSSANEALYSYVLFESLRPKTLYAGIEIGSKGVKAMVIELSPADEEGIYNTDTKMRKSINTGIISNVVKTGLFLDSAINETALAVKELLYEIKDKYGVLETNIFIVGSSGLLQAKNKNKLLERVYEQTGKEMGFISAEKEVFFNILGSIPEKYRSSALSLDIGSGNTKIGFIENLGDSSRTVSIEIPFGTVSFTDTIQKEAGTKEKFVAISKRLNKLITDKIDNEAQRKPVLKNRSPIFIVGGIVWAMTTLLYPENQDSFVKLTASDINRFYVSLAKNLEGVLNPDPSKIKDNTIREEALKQIQAVKDTFTNENLIAGAEILKATSDKLNFKNKELYFSRYGSWLWGYIAAGGVEIEDKKRGILRDEPKKPEKVRL